MDFRNCPEIQAAYLEIVNLVISHQSPSISADLLSICYITPSSLHPRSSALLDVEVAAHRVWIAAASGNSNQLRTHLFDALNSDVNTACRMLEAIPDVPDSISVFGNRLELCTLYGEVCARTSAPEARARALSNLGPLMDEIICRGEPMDLLGAEFLEKVWMGLQDGDINPTLSCAIIRSSGTFMAALTSSGAADSLEMEHRLRGWGAMIADALDIDNVSAEPAYALMATLLRQG